MIRLTLFVLATLSMFLGAGRLQAADDAGGPWTIVPIDKEFSAWRAGEHKGWSIVADAKLDSDNEKRLAAADGKADAPQTLLSGGESDLYTKEEFQDVEIKFEFMIPKGSNAGVKLNGHYEIQIRDTAGKPVDQLTGDDLGGVYPRGENRPRYHQIDKGVAPKVNAAKPAGQWQTLQIAFIAPRFDAEGKKTADARFVRVVLNGETIHEDIDLKWPTGAAWDEAKEIPRGPVQLQGDHGSFAFRNLQVRPLPAPK